MRAAALALHAALCLAACGERAAAPPAPGPSAPARVAAPSQDVLMRAVFGKAWRPASKDALAPLSDPDARATTLIYVVTPVASSVLKNGDAVLVANAGLADEEGQARPAHATPGLLNLFILRYSNGSWRAIKRHENVASLGSFGQLGDVQFTQLASDKPGLAVLHGGTWQGYTLTILSLFDLGATHPHDLAGMRLHSDSDGGCDPGAGRHCWHVGGQWRLLPPATPAAAARYDDLEIVFSGTTRDGAKPERAVEGRARYRYDGKQYRLREGKNLAPEV